MALSRYQRKRIDELELFPGDILRINSELEPGWWIGEIVLPVDADNRKGQATILSIVIFIQKHKWTAPIFDEKILKIPHFKLIEIVVFYSSCDVSQ